MILAAAAVAGCSRQGEASRPATEPTTRPLPPDAVDAGPIGDYGHSGVYDKFSEDGFFIVRRAQEVFALSSVCTHRACTVRLQEDGSFYCHCHHSRFDPDGHVVRGPARRDLPRLAVAMDERKHLLVRQPKEEA